jgi:hypothetical protein
MTTFWLMMWSSASSTRRDAAGAATRGVRVASDAAQEHAASSAAVAEAAAPPRAQARRESSRRGAQHSCYPLVDRGTRQARGQRAAWRRSVAPKKAAALACVRSVPWKRAAARAAWRGTRGAERKPYDSRREHRAPEGFSTRGCHLQAERLSRNCTLGLHDAAQQRRRSTPHTPCSCATVYGTGRRRGCGCEWRVRSARPNPKFAAARVRAMRLYVVAVAAVAFGLCAKRSPTIRGQKGQKAQKK